MAKKKSKTSVPQVAPARRRNICHTFNGKSLTIPQWANEVGIKASALYQRLGKLGWDLERALTTPVRGYRVAAA